jgi:hypothetical protein
MEGFDKECYTGDSPRGVVRESERELIEEKGM